MSDSTNLSDLSKFPEWFLKEIESEVFPYLCKEYNTEVNWSNYKEYITISIDFALNRYSIKYSRDIQEFEKIVDFGKFHVAGHPIFNNREFKAIQTEPDINKQLLMYKKYQNEISFRIADIIEQKNENKRLKSIYDDHNNSTRERDFKLTKIALNQYRNLLKKVNLQISLIEKTKNLSQNQTTETDTVKESSVNKLDFFTQGKNGKYILTGSATQGQFALCIWENRRDLELGKDVVSIENIITNFFDIPNVRKRLYDAKASNLKIQPPPKMIIELRQILHK